MSTLAINGFGRIGRMVLRAILADPDCAGFQIAAINDLMDTKTLAHLFKYDSVHGVSSANIDYKEDSLVVNDRAIRVLAERNPENLPWKKLGVDIAIEATGIFATREGGLMHLRSGAGKVIISAPADDADITVVLGVNQNKYDPSQHQILSNASCTTNCVAPVVKVLNDFFGIKRGLMTTVHSYTNDQRILDVPHKDLRRARAANLSMIPTSTGAAKAVGLVLPELKGKLDGMAIRVPTPNVSLIDLVVELKKEADVEDINAAFIEVSKKNMKGILRYEDEPLVSVDFNGNDASSVVDTLSTRVMDKRMAKILAWYDNEWGYSNRVKDLVKFLSNKET